MRLFKMVQLKSLNKQKKIIILTMVSFMVSIALLSCIFMLNESKNNFAKKEAYLLNRGDLAISFAIGDGDNNTPILNSLFYQYLSNETSLHFTSEQFISTDTTSECYVNRDTILGIKPIYCFIDFNEIDRFVNKEFSKYERLTKDTVILNDIAASRLNATTGDYLNILTSSERTVEQFEIIQIIPDVGLTYKLLNSMVGCIYLDKSVIPSLFELSVDSNLINLFFYQTFYIDGDITDLQKAAHYANSIAAEAGTSDNLYISFASNMTKSMNDSVRIYNAILSFFTILCLFTAIFSIIQLQYIRIINRQKELVILKILGMQNQKSTIYHMLELLLYILPVLFLGIIMAYAIITPIGSQIALFGIQYFGKRELIKAVTKTTIAVISIAVVIVMPLIYFVNHSNIQDVLRRQNVPILLKKQILFVSILSVLYILILFSYFNGLKFSMILVSTTLLLFAFLIILCKFLIKLLNILHPKSYLAIGINFIKRNNIRVLFSIATISLCLTLLLTAITIAFTSTKDAANYIFNNFGYNFEVNVSAEQKDSFEQFLLNNNIDYYYAVSDTRAIIEAEVVNNRSSYNVTSRPLHIFYSVPDKPAFRALNEGAILGKSLSTRYNLHIGSDFNIKVGESIIPLKLSGKEDTRYKDSRGEISITSDMLLDSSSLLSLQKKYFFNIIDEHQDLIKRYADNTNGIFAQTLSDIVQLDQTLLSKFIFLYKIFLVFFLISVTILVLNCSIITYKHRLQEFCIYETYGTTRKMLHRVILLENSLIAGISTIIAIALTSLLVWIIGLFMTGTFIHINLIYALIIFIISFIIMLFSSIMVFNITPFKSLSEILRSET